MTEEQLIDAVFDREGRRYGDQHTTPPIDQPTAPGGIVLKTLSEYLGRQATLAELRALTPATARPIVRWKLRQLAQMTGYAAIVDEPLRLQLLDFAYNSGPAIATRWLQRVLRVEPDGQFGPITRQALERADPWLVHHALIAARLQMLDMWTDAAAKRKAWEEGLENRALLFSRLLAQEASS
jgi:lysozyme family protein